MRCRQSRRPGKELFPLVAALGFRRTFRFGACSFHSSPWLQHFTREPHSQAKLCRAGAATCTRSHHTPHEREQPPHTAPLHKERDHAHWHSVCCHELVQHACGDLGCSKSHVYVRPTAMAVQTPLLQCRGCRFKVRQLRSAVLAPTGTQTWLQIWDSNKAHCGNTPRRTHGPRPYSPGMSHEGVGQTTHT